MSEYTVPCVGTKSAVGELHTAVESHDRLTGVVRHSVPGAVETTATDELSFQLVGADDEETLTVILPD